MNERSNRVSFSLRTDDIAGAKPCLKSYQFTNKPSYSNSTSGIDKSTPLKFESKTERHTNPLTPEYKLPTYTPRPITPPKFIRDTLDVKDISRVSTGRLIRSSLRNSLDVSDISTKVKRVSGKVEKEDLKEVNGQKFESKRVTNPLSPEYVIRDSDNKVVKVGEIEGSSPKASYDIKTKPHNRNLDVSDISIKSAKPPASSYGIQKPKLRLQDVGVNLKAQAIKNSEYNSVIYGKPISGKGSAAKPPKGGSLRQSLEMGAKLSSGKILASSSSQNSFVSRKK